MLNFVFLKVGFEVENVLMFILSFYIILFELDILMVPQSTREPHYWRMFGWCSNPNNTH